MLNIFYNNRSNKSDSFFIIGLLVVILLIGGFFASHGVQAQDFGTGYLTGLNLPSQDLRITIVNIIRITLGAIGVIFLVIIIYGGYLWMTAGGDSQRVGKAKKIITNAVIGLIIIFMAFAITTFVFNILQGSVGPPPPPSCIEGEIQGCLRCVGGSWIFDPTIPGCLLPGSEFRINDLETAHGGSDNSQDVYLCSSIQANFNNNIDQDTIAGNVSLTQGSANIPITINSTSRSIETDPDSNLLPEIDYTAHYNKAISDTSGLPLSSCNPFSCQDNGSEFIWNFTTGTELDETAPFITSTSPISDSANPGYPDRNVSRDKIIRVNFSESIRAVTFDDETGHPISKNIIIEELSGQGGAVVSTIDSQLLEVFPINRGFDLRWVPPNLFDPFTWYRVTIQNIEDLCGNPMAATFVWEFETNDKAPGVGGWYPQGANICPDVGVVTVTFNTSMFYDMVAIAISDGINPFGAAFRPSDLDTGPYQVSIPEGTWSVDPASDFKVFTFTLNNSLSTQTQYQINITTDRIINIDGELLEHSWNFSVSDSASCSCAPYISSINPDQGLLGQCVTITGQCFKGAVPDDPTDPRYADISALSFNGVPAVIGGQDKNFVTTSIPNTFSQGDILLPQVTITYNDPTYGSLTTNNTNVDFYVASNEEAQGPCLLSLNPGQACFQDTISLNGLRFGADPGAGSRSTLQDNITYSDGAVQVPDSQVLSWSDIKIQTLVPTDASDGGVAVTAGGLLSNSIPFDLACGAGEPCSKDPLTCDPDNSRCEPGLLCNNTTCLCEFPVEPNAPLVIAKWPTCALSCTNAGIGAKFNMDMDAATINNRDDNLNVKPCGIDCTEPNLGSEISYTSIDYDPVTRQINISPAGVLTENIHYRVTLSANILSVEGKAIGNLNYDSDNDGFNDSYSWTFGTKDGSCELTGVTINPVNATADRVNQRIGYNSYAIGSNQQCGNQIINPWSVDWVWTSSVSAVASITSDDNNNDTLIDPRQTAVALSEGQTTIRTSSGTYFADGLLTVDFISCNDDGHCLKSGLCLGSVCDDVTKTCTPVINSLQPDTGPVSRWTTIKGCYFGSQQGDGLVTLGGVEAPLPQACGPAVWQNDQIIVEVPDVPAAAQDVVVTTNRGLFSNSNTFNVTNECAPGVPIPDSGVPGICWLRPSIGSILTNVNVEGDHFGLIENNVTFENINSGRSAAIINDWANKKIKTVVPADAATGDVIVEVSSGAGFCSSNGVNFTVDIGIGTTCSTNPDQCVPEDNHCGDDLGLYCEPSSCTCQPALAPQVDSVIPAGNDVCRNIVAEVTFDQKMNKSTLPGNVLLEVNSTETCPVAVLESGIRNQESRITKIFKPLINLIYRLTQSTINLTKAQGPNWCKVSTSLNSFDSGNQTVVKLTPSILNPNTQYRIRVLTGAKSSYGVNLASEYIQDPPFITGAEICQISQVETTIIPPGIVKTSDFFTCAGRDDCVGDVLSGNVCQGGSNDGNICVDNFDCPGGICSAGNQHQWISEAQDIDGNLLQAEYHWTPVDPESLFSLNNTEIADIFMTPQPYGGRARFAVGAHDESGFFAGAATSTVTAEIFLCENPWPSLTEDFPFKDNDTDFSFYYCRDRGSGKICFNGNTPVSPVEICSTNTDCDVALGETCRLDISDDLPKLSYPPVVSGPSEDIKKEFLFLLPVPSTDAIALRVYDNLEYLSPSVWYNKNVPNPGSPQTIEVNGYEAVKDNRTVYVNAAQEIANNTYSTNIYVISYNKEAESDTINIFNQLLDNWKFTTNLKDLNICSLDNAFYCTSDAECQNQSPSKGICQIDAAKIRRDAKRVTNLGAIKSLLKKYRGICSNDIDRGCLNVDDCVGNPAVITCDEKNNTYPQIKSGSFIVGQTTSRWIYGDNPSWYNQLGAALEVGTAMPVDPLNDFSSCPVNYDQQVCWDDANKVFDCAPGSHIYWYETSDGSSYNLYANLEFDNIEWQGFGNSGAGDSCKSFEVIP